MNGGVSGPMLATMLAQAMAQTDLAGVSPWVDVAQSFGVPMALVGFFTWWSYNREQKLTDRIAIVEDRSGEFMQRALQAQQEALTVMREATEEQHRLVDRAEQVIAANTAVLHDVSTVIRTCAERKT